MILNSGISLNNSLSVFGESLSDVKLRKYIKSINEELIKRNYFKQKYRKNKCYSQCIKGIFNNRRKKVDCLVENIGKRAFKDKEKDFIRY